VVAVSTVISIASVVSVAAVVMSIPPMPPAPSIPGTCADKDAACKPCRTVIAVRSAGVGVIRVVAPIAHGRTVIYRSRNHCRPNSNSHRDLSIRRDCGCKGQRQERREQD
jgi:hypothetical protein